MFLSPGWSCPKEDQASHLVALLHPTNCPVSEQYIALSLRFCVSFPPKRELLPRCCHPMDLSSRRRLNRFAAFRTLSACLIGPVYSVPRDQDDAGLHRSGRNIVVSK